MDDKANREFASGASPVNWYEVAKIMHENAQSLHNTPQDLITHKTKDKSVTMRVSDRSVYLLAAFALENLIKAFLIYENPYYIEGGKLSREILNGHGLSELQKKCKRIPAPKRTLHVFETLEVGINSWARYPCSTSIARETTERYVTPEFWESYKDVFDLYSKRLEELLSKKWKGPYGEVSYVEFK